MDQKRVVRIVCVVLLCALVAGIAVELVAALS
jgi:hypothetical protein